MADDVAQRPGEPAVERRRYLRRSLLFVAAGMAVAALPLVAFPGGEVQLIGSVIPVALMTVLYRAAHGKSERGHRWLHGARAEEPRHALHAVEHSQRLARFADQQ
jgi:hypothetical protein